MADWIEYRKALRDHIKVHRLAKALSIPYAHALGLVSCLWLWAVDNASDGQLRNVTDDELAAAAKWDGAANGFRSHLIDVGWLDSNGRIHRWERYGTRLLRESQARLIRYRAKHHMKRYKKHLRHVA